MKRNHANRTIRARVGPELSKLVDKFLKTFATRETDLVRDAVIEYIKNRMPIQ